MGARLPIYRRGRKYLVDYRKLGPAFFPEKCTSGRKLYDTKAEAEGAASVALDDAEASRHETLDFTPEMRRAAIDAFKLLPDFPASDLIEAAREFAERHRPGAKKRTVAELVEEFIQAHEATGKAALTLRNYRMHFARFARDFGPRDAASLEGLEIEQWLEAPGKNSKGKPAPAIRGENRKNYRRYLGHLFRFAMDRNYTRRNPAAAIPKVKIKRHMPGILNAHQLKLLLDAAEQYAGGVMLPYFALCALAGLRPSEARRLDWAAIDLEKREVYLSPEVAGKTYADRYATMPPNLIEWLSLVPAAGRCGKIVWTRKLYEGARRKAGADIDAAMKATKDILRHSAASHLYAKSKSADLVTANLGHELRIFLKHYRATISEAEGDAYFNVRPGSAGARVVPMKQEASG